MKVAIYANAAEVPKPYSVGCPICNRAVGKAQRDLQTARALARRHLLRVHAYDIPLSAPNPWRAKRLLTDVLDSL